ncbi:endo-dextranase [Labilibaculum antarcticum]|uniref:Cycloisomaltooligosaccharide glucanotransferase n=1 Tax=Labilibaculum antarcticum TaxID=1717717 RepID=A0A1Y1CQY9_9BACT|nr:glycoside hydrolase family 66 protein [Labilibaculum antarcticum]BAX82403.1 cycloisomaltooligosaccharide glucanotransferase [Labilibaculum antarcticum]
MKNSLKFLLIIVITLFACEKSENNPKENPAPVAPEYSEVSFVTNKARYNPGEEVDFVIDKEISSSASIRYRHLNEIIKENSYSGRNWTWKVPVTDFTGYMIDLYEIVDGKEIVYGSIAVDVSSDWTRFPRYGFLSEFDSAVSTEEIRNTLDQLTRYHINGLQYYDWHNKHHKPLKMEGNTPSETWQDIARRNVSFKTVENYIQNAKSRNISSMSYNLLFGAWEDFETDGVDKEWMIFNDANHQNINKHELDDNWALSDILVVNPANEDWEEYIFAETENIYQFLDFDGWHLDQLGDRGKVYDYQGNSVDLKQGYNSFLNSLDQHFEGKKMVMNAVNQFGQAQILNTGVDFAYTEVWYPNERYDDLGQIIMDNNALSSNTKNTVLAAYMNYDLANSNGNFNTPAILYTDAVIFAFGGAHLELGEHMLGKEYFPNNNLLMRADLKESLIEYYDFMVAYQNLLRDGGNFNSPLISSTDGKLNLNAWPPQYNNVAVIGKEVGNRQIIHLLNFANVTSLDWRDNSGTQTFPQTEENCNLQISVDKTVAKLWYASPDSNFGIAVNINFTQNGNKLSFQLPYLKYWDMIVVEFE